MSHFVTVDELVGGALFGATSLFLPGYSTAQRVVVPATGASVFVYLRGTTTQVQAYADQHGAGSASAQPLTTDIDGHVVDSGGHQMFVAQPVELDVVVSGGGLATPKTLPSGAAPEAGGGAASGTVTQVNGVNPDASGHVTLTPAAIAADASGAAASAQSAAQAYTDLKVALLAPKASPALTGTPTAPTPAAGTNSTVLATTAFVQAAVAGVSGGASTTVPEAASSPVTGAAYTFVPADMGCRVNGNSASAQTFTVPTGLPVNSVWFVAQLGVGQITIVGASGVTLHSPAGAKTAGQWAEIGLTVISANTVLLSGNLSAT